MGDSASRTAFETLEALESRIRRVSWYLTGSDNVESALQEVAVKGTDQTASARLAKLEYDLEKLSLRSIVVRDLLQIYAKYPDLFHPDATDVPTTLSATELLAVINSCATAFPTTASRLNAVKDLPIPSTDSSVSLISLQPRLAKLELLQDAQAQEMTELRARSASAIQRWYELGVLGESECWTEWEGRVIDVEKKVRRQEVHQAQDLKEEEAYR
ncbi:hypothetical protein P7C71_g4348, partial [Lecanoromycetidae sp. Uapishka_2]